MAASLGFSTFQTTLVKELEAQKLDENVAKPGSGEPQVSSITIRAMKGNGGIIYVGGSAGEATKEEGFELAAGDALSLDIEGTGNIWINGTKTGDKVCVAAVGP